MSESKKNAISLPNATQIPNIIFDYWLKELCENEFVVLFIFTAETYRFPFKENGVEICEKDLLKKTSLTLRHLKNSIQYLEDQGLIRIEKSSKDNPNQCNIYHLTQKVFEKS